MNKKDLPHDIIGELFIGARGPVKGRKLTVVSVDGIRVTAVFIYPNDPNTGKPIRQPGTRQLTAMSLESLLHTYDHIPTVDVREAARLLNMTTFNVEFLCRKGDIQADFIGGEWRVWRFTVVGIETVVDEFVVKPRSNSGDRQSLEHLIQNPDHSIAEAYPGSMANFNPPSKEPIARPFLGADNDVLPVPEVQKVGRLRRMWNRLFPPLQPWGRE